MRIPPFRRIRPGHEDVDDGNEDGNIRFAQRDVGATAQQPEEAVAK